MTDTPSHIQTLMSRMTNPTVSSQPGQMSTLVNLVLDRKDNTWLQLDVCTTWRDTRKCPNEELCCLAHPPPGIEILESNRVVACYDDVKKGACKRKDCKFYHPPNHLKNVVHTNGRNNLRMRNELKQQIDAMYGSLVAPSYAYYPLMADVGGGVSGHSGHYGYISHPSSEAATQSRHRLANTQMSAVRHHPYQPDRRPAGGGPMTSSVVTRHEQPASSSDLLLGYPGSGVVSGVMGAAAAAGPGAYPGYSGLIPMQSLPPMFILNPPMTPATGWTIPTLGTNRDTNQDTSNV